MQGKLGQRRGLTRATRANGNPCERNEPTNQQPKKNGDSVVAKGNGEGSYFR